MTKEEYREWRKKLGTQSHVAKLLRVSVNTLSRRELGHLDISDEAALAIIHLTSCVYLKRRRPLSDPPAS